VNFFINNFLTFRRINPIRISLPNGSHVFAYYDGTIALFEKKFLYNVLYVPKFAFNLVSVQKLVKNHNCKLTITSEFCQIQNAESLKMIGCARLNRGLYLIDTPKHEVTINTAGNLNIPDQSVTKNIWHHKLGHQSNRVLQHMRNIFPYISFYENKPCDVCHYAKQHKLSFTHNSTRTKNIFDMIHVDIWGPFGTASIHGHKFFLTIVDDHNRFTWVYPMIAKSETRDALSRFITLIYNQFNTVIKVVRSDNGNEFACATLYKSLVILHQTSCVETAQQKNFVERKHQHILNVTRSILF